MDTIQNCIFGTGNHKIAPTNCSVSPHECNKHKIKKINNIQAESTILMLKVNFSQAVITYF